MKEQVYAWYPPATSIWKKYRDDGQVDSYTKECLYRFGISRFKSNKKTIERRSKDDSDATKEKTLIGSRIQLIPKPPSTALTLSTPARHHPFVEVDNLKKYRTEKAMISLEKGLAARGTNAQDERRWAQTVVPNFKSMDQFQGGGSGIDRDPSASHIHRRVQSALIQQRPGITERIAERSVKSAGPQRTVESTVKLSASSVASAALLKEGEDVPPPRLSRSSSSRRPQAPTPGKWMEEEEEEERKSGEEKGMESFQTAAALDYDEQLKIHGWKMEIPGDPFHLKRPCIQTRHSTFVSVQGLPSRRRFRSPTKKQDEMQSYETFFYNTIPRQVLSFTISPDWASELLQAKQLELKQRTINAGRSSSTSSADRRNTFRPVDYSFVY